ncbi:hypothetical protein NIES593_22730 [Hydrococcus rivularis NIES-593]|uniref:Uncharacterized protein n=2 Tax=Cyanophyceae TaxID=3028117 RepID=A0A1U7H754_9CYAN|nr:MULTISPECIES: hypothetical protein [Cyanophyceae]OKH10812.1 hypothetical protein NIES592_23835 [Fischerella major NIES-592]OKH17838.1 hypothetical protein NIES593_22730 [Hydrococcus rivularis NIES-593]
MNAEIDNFPVSQLQSRYSIGKQAVYNRLDALDIKPFKEGNKSYINASQLRSLDELHQHIADGGTMATFGTAQNSQAGQLEKLDSPVDAIESPVDASPGYLVKALIQEIGDRIAPKSPLWYHSELERAKASDWLLTTAEIQKLIGVKPKVERGQKSYKRGNWIFVKAGKIGNQTAWRVMKE